MRQIRRATGSRLRGHALGSGENMRTKMVAAMVAAGTIALGAPTAGASNHYAYLGGCDFRSVQQEDVTGQNYDGALVALAVLYSPDVAANPVAGTITCDIQVNGAIAASIEASGTAVLATAARVSYAASDSDVVRLCETVTYRGGSGTTACRDVANGAVPPQEVWDALDAAYETGRQIVEALVKGVADPAVCPVLAGLSGEYGAVTVNPQGDVYVVGDPLWDCPPYDLVPAPPPWYRPPPTYAGGIVISNFGTGTTWQRTGVLANTAWWSCGLVVGSPPTVACNWVGGPTPRCRTQVVTAAVLPTLPSMTWGTARAQSLCDFQSIATGVANGSTGNQFKFNGLSWAPPLATAWQVRCRADNGSNGAPVPQYVVDCDFVF